jgi:RND family efflux transporter MFP subunit
MTVPSCHSLIAMLCMLLMGVGLGMLLMTSHDASVPAVVEAPRAVATPVLDPAVGPTSEPATPEAPTPPAPDQYVGVIFARHLVDMAARSEGRVEAVYVHLGDHLRPGDVIAQMESSAVRQQLAMAEASLRSAQAEVRSTTVELKDAEVRHTRREGLLKAGLISGEELATAAVQVERARTHLEVAQARVAEQRARVKQTQESLAHTVITATFEGTVAARYLDPGAMVRAGSPVINLMRSEDLWVRFAAPEERRVTMPVGTSVSVHLAEIPGVIPGRIAHLAPGVESMSREVIVEAQLHVPAAWRGQMKPGLSGYVVATSGQQRDAGPGRLRTSASQAR